MTHYFDFRADLHNGDFIQQRYKGKSSRKKNVAKLIMADLKKLYNVTILDIKDFYLAEVKL